MKPGGFPVKSENSLDPEPQISEKCAAHVRQLAILQLLPSPTNLIMSRPFQSASAGILAFVLTLSCLTAPFARAQSVDEPKIVRDIDVQYIGDASVNADRILSNMSLKVGDTFSQAVVEDDIKSLFASGNFENIRILTEPVGANGVRVIVVVETRSRLDKVAFQGNTEFSDLRLKSKVDLTSGQTVNESQVQAGQREILRAYQEAGFTEASVNYDIVSSGRKGFSNVVYKIDEGGKSLLRDIEFVGNTAFTTRQLRGKMKSKEKSLFSAITNSGKLSSDQLDQDIEAIEKHYRDAGYLNAKVVDTRRVRVDDKRVDLVLTIDEGDVYNINNVSLAGVRAFNVGDLTPFLKTGGGQTFSAANIEADIESLRDYYGSRGYAEARVTPQLDSAGGTAVDVTYDVFEGDKFHIRQINFTGNEKTKEKVLRNEMAVQPGEVYNTPRIAASKRRLENTGYFQAVDVLPSDTDRPEYKDININVTERPTGTFNFGAGFSSIDNFVGFVEITQTNFDIGNWPGFTGAGQRFRAAARVGTERKDFVVSLTEPWFMDRPLALGFEGFFRELFFLSDDYDQTNYGGAITLRKKIGEHSHLQGEYRLQNVEIDVDPRASQILQAEDGEYMQSMLGLDYIHDTRDDLFLPRSGHRLNVGGAYSGLGGDVEDTHVEAGAIQYVNLPFDTIFSLQGHFHSVNGDDVPIFDRRFLGGANNLRGFDYRDVGPKDETGEPIGGKTSGWATAELTVPIIRQLRGALFYDIGVVSPDDFSLDGDVNSNWGFGIRLFLPVGPLRLDYGIPISSDEFNDNSGRFNFNIGYRF